MILFIQIEELLVPAWFGIVENLAVDVLLGTSLVDWCIRSIFPTEQKVVSWSLRPAAINLTKAPINPIHADITVFNMHTDKDTLDNEQYLCRVEKQITILAHMPAAILMCSQGPGLIKIETHCNIVERRCSIAVRGLMDIFPTKSFHVYVAKLTANPGNVPNLPHHASSTPGIMSRTC